MATYVKELHNKSTGDTIYPATKALAVFRSDNTTTVEQSLSDIEDRLDKNDAITRLTMVPNTNYCEFGNSQFNRAFIKDGVCYVHLNFRITASIPSVTPIITGLPKPLDNIPMCFNAGNANGTYRLRVYNGNIDTDGAQTLTGWFDASLAYLIDESE